MGNNYKQLLKEITLNGFFSEYLPPCFYVDKEVLNWPPKEECDLIAPYTYSMSRFNKENGRRYISIPEIGSYLVAYSFMKENNILEELVGFCENSNVSFSPIIGTDGSIITHEQAYDGRDDTKSSDKDSYSLYIENVCQKIELSSGARKVIHLDISNCFSSFYMHMIPSIILGFEEANRNYLLSCKSCQDQAINSKYETYAKFDSIIRKQNLNRTNGLLVGPQFSRIIIESIFCRIDKDIAKQHSEIKYTRYVDDFEVYVFDGQKVDEIIRIFSDVFRKYGFSINSEKTEIFEYPFYVISNLQRIYDNANASTMDKSDLMKLFNDFWAMEVSGTKGAIRFLLKNIEADPINTSEKSLYKSYLLSILSNDTRSMVKACALLCDDNIPIEPCDNLLIKNQLLYHLLEKHDLEVIWLLYILIKWKQFDHEIIEKIVDSDNELAQIMLLDNQLLTDDSIDKIAQKRNVSWLLLYELYAEGKISEEYFVKKLDLEKSVEFYKRLKAKSILFCKPISN